MSQNIRAGAGLLLAPRQDLERGRVGLGEHVGLVDPGEALDRGAVEADALGEGALELGRRDRDRLQVAEHVGEPQPHEPDVALLERAEHELLLPVHRPSLPGPRFGACTAAPIAGSCQPVGTVRAPSRWPMPTRLERARAAHRACPGQRHRRRSGRQRRHCVVESDPRRAAARAPHSCLPGDDADRLPGRGPGAAPVVRRRVDRRARGAGTRARRGEGLGDVAVVIGYLDRRAGPAAAGRRAGRRAAGRGRGAARRQRRDHATPSTTCPTTACSTSSATSCPATRCRCSGCRPRAASRHRGRDLRGPLAGRRAGRGRQDRRREPAGGASTPRRTSATRTTCGWRCASGGPPRPAPRSPTSNLVGGQDELVFDGDSIVVAAGRRAAGPRRRSSTRPW